MLQLTSQPPGIIGPRETDRIQIISGPQHRDQIERAGAITMIALRPRPADARAPSIGIVEDEQRHARGPGTVERSRLFDNHVLELICRPEGSQVHCRHCTSHCQKRSTLRCCCGELSALRGSPNSSNASGRGIRPRRAIHAGQLPPTPKAEETTGRPPAARSSRPSEAATIHSPALRRERPLPSVTDRCRRKAGDWLSLRSGPLNSERYSAARHARTRPPRNRLTKESLTKESRT
jgi:hypothetical protein